MSKKSIDIGTQAPAFSLSAVLPDGSESTIQLSDFNGRGLVVFFYPRDNTPGCTTEAGDFSDAYSEFQTSGYDVVGMSTDSLESHRKFVAKLNLPFALLTDDNGVVATQYGCYGLKKMYGKEFMGVTRSTFLIDEQGKISEIWRKVKVPGHVQEVMQRIKQL